MVNRGGGQCQCQCQTVSVKVSLTHLKQALQLLKFIFQDAKLLLSKSVMLNSPKVGQISYQINPHNILDPIIPPLGWPSLDMRFLVLRSALVQGLPQDVNVKPSHIICCVVVQSPQSPDTSSQCVVWDFLPVLV